MGGNMTGSYIYVRRSIYVNIYIRNSICTRIYIGAYHTHLEYNENGNRTVSTENTTPPKSTKSKDSDSSVSCGTNSEWDCVVIWICTKEFEFLDLVEWRGAARAVESVTIRHYGYEYEYEYVEVADCRMALSQCRGCNTLQHTATHCNTLQHTATHCNTLQHTATHCNTKTTWYYSNATAADCTMPWLQTVYKRTYTYICISIDM